VDVRDRVKDEPGCVEFLRIDDKTFPGLLVARALQRGR